MRFSGSSNNYKIRFDRAHGTSDLNFKESVTQKWAATPILGGAIKQITMGHQKSFYHKFGEEETKDILNGVQRPWVVLLFQLFDGVLQGDGAGFLAVGTNKISPTSQ